MGAQRIVHQPTAPRVLPVPGTEVAALTAMPALARVALGIIATAEQAGHRLRDIARSCAIPLPVLTALVDPGRRDRSYIHLRRLLLAEQILRGLGVELWLMPASGRPQHIILAARDPRRVDYQRLRQQGYAALCRTARRGIDPADALSPFMRERLRTTQIALSQRLAGSRRHRTDSLHAAIGWFAHRLGVTPQMLPLISGCSQPYARQLLAGRDASGHTPTLRPGPTPGRTAGGDRVSDAVLRLIVSQGYAIELRRDRCCLRLAVHHRTQVASIPASGRPGVSLLARPPLRSMAGPPSGTMTADQAHGWLVDRLRLGLTLADIARSWGVTRQAVHQRVCSIDYDPQYATVLRQAQAVARRQGQSLVPLAPETAETRLYAGLIEQPYPSHAALAQVFRSAASPSVQTAQARAAIPPRRGSAAETPDERRCRLGVQEANLHVDRAMARRLPAGWSALEAVWYLGQQRGPLPRPILGLAFAVHVDQHHASSLHVIETELGEWVRRLPLAAQLPLHLFAPHAGLELGAPDPQTTRRGR